MFVKDLRGKARVGRWIINEHSHKRRKLIHSKSFITNEIQELWAYVYYLNSMSSSVKGR